ncbi:MAG: phosphoserine phosphatase SerB [Alphaproteobacteria bacterium]|nr:phosphoserine phosphatase SerB [Alphaproteobacteria bacterium]
MSPTHVVTVINDPAAPPLSVADGTDIRLTLQIAGATARDADWLATGIALDLPFSGIDPRHAEEAVRAHLTGRRADVVAQPLSQRRKKLLVADMDSTIIGQECLDELAARAGVGAQVAALTERAMRGEIDFAAALRERVTLLRGRSVALLERTFEEAVRLNPGARTLVRTMREYGAHTALVTGGFLFFTSRIAGLAGFDSFSGNQFEERDGVLTGGITGPIFGADAKLQRLRELMESLNVLQAETLALGDGANDIPMLQAVGLGVAYHAKAKVRAAVPARIDFGDLTAALYLQGYRRTDFIDG